MILPTETLQKARIISSIAAITIGVSACGGGGSNSPLNDDATIIGTLVAPETITGVDAMLDDQVQSVFNVLDECPEVPAGYTPLSSASITFIDANGTPLGETFTAGSCGEFSANAPAGAVGIEANAPGFRPLQAQTEVFIGTTGSGVASTIADTAVYEIGALQIVNDGTVAFTVTDSESRRAVLGIPASAFNVLIDGASIIPESVASASSIINDQAATAVLTLDASGSMTINAFTDESGTRFSRNQLAAVAAHQFLDEKAANDAVALSIFSTSIFFLDQQEMNDSLAIESLEGVELEYQLSVDGFTTDAARLRFPLDAYNRESALYEGESGDALNPDTPTNFQLQSGRYPFGGGTNLYGAVVDAIERLSTRGAARPVVVAMTDGRDNGRFSVEDAIAAATSSGIPVYTIGMDASRAADELQRVAEQTGGAFFNITSLEIGDAFQSIQTGIVFQYLANLTNAGLDGATTLGITMDFNGLTAQRTLDRAQ